MSCLTWNRLLSRVAVIATPPRFTTRFVNPKYQCSGPASASVAPLACADLASGAVCIPGHIFPLAAPSTPSNVILALNGIFGNIVGKSHLKLSHRVLDFLSLMMRNNTWLSCLFAVGLIALSCTLINRGSQWPEPCLEWTPPVPLLPGGIMDGDPVC